MAIKQPDDKSYFILPDLGEGVHEAELIRWRVKPGDRVDEHQTIAEMETDKALVEVPSPWRGRITELHGNEGDILNVGNKLVSYEGTAAASGDVAASRQVDEAAADDAGTVVGTVAGELTVADRFRRRAETVETALTQAKALATPAVRRIARELGIDIDLVPGTGRGGRVTATDVEAFAGATPTGASPIGAMTVPSSALPPPTVVLSPDGISERIPIRGMRRRIAQSLDLAVKTAVHFTVVDEADVTALDEKRREYIAVTGRKISYLPFLMTAVCRALRVHPSLNANVDDAGQEILVKSVINLGCAVDTEHGLMVPVVLNADKLSLVQLGDAVESLAEKCRNRSIERGALTGGTFTISNVGSYGGMFATPIINYPEVGIIAAGRVKERVLTSGGRFYAGKVMPLSLSCDHRVVDGAEGARFVNTVVGLLESPDQLVRG